MLNSNEVTVRALNLSVLNLDNEIAARLTHARNSALSRKKAENLGRLSSVSAMVIVVGNALSSHVRTLVVIIALTIGLFGTRYWEGWESAESNAEIDAALLADELPIAAYTDRGFYEWLLQPSVQHEAIDH